MNNEAFIQTILETPEDDGPRLVYADWLDDRGDGVRAEFIRLQCQIARSPPDDDRLSGFVARECRIYAAHSRHWHSLAYPKFRRGFVEEAALTRGDLRGGLDGLFAIHPLRSLWITGQDPEDAGVAESDHLSRLEALGVSYPTEGEMWGLCRSPRLSGLQSLALHHTEESLPEGFLGDWFAGLAAPVPPGLRGLRRLVLWHGNLDDAGLRALLASHAARALTALDLTGNPLSSEGVGRLARHPLFLRLDDLSLREVSCEDLGALRALVRRLGKARIRRLSLQGCEPGRDGDRALAALVNAPSWGALEALDLSGWVLDETLEELLRCPHLAQLKRLDLSGTQFQDRHIRAIADCPFLTGLSHLHIGSGPGRNGPFGDAAYVALASSPHLRNLRVLDLTDGCYSTEAGIRSLARSPVAARLRSLGVQATNAGLHALASAGLHHLNRLFVYLHEVGDGEGLRALASSPRLPNLAILTYRGDDIPEEVQAALLQAPKLAWPGVSPHGASPAVQDLFRRRFDRDYWVDFGSSFEDAHPFFPWWG